MLLGRLCQFAFDSALLCTNGILAYTLTNSTLLGCKPALYQAAQQHFVCRKRRMLSQRNFILLKSLMHILGSSTLPGSEQYAVAMVYPRLYRFICFAAHKRECTHITFLIYKGIQPLTFASGLFYHTLGLCHLLFKPAGTLLYRMAQAFQAAKACRKT